MNRAAKRKTSLPLDAGALDAARDPGINVSAVADAAAFEAKAAWHGRNGHPLADILAGPGGGTWKD